MKRFVTIICILISLAATAAPAGSPSKATLGKPVKAASSQPVTHNEMVRISEVIRAQAGGHLATARSNMKPSPLPGVLASMPSNTSTASLNGMRIAWNSQSGSAAVISAIPPEKTHSLPLSANASAAEKTIAFIGRHNELFHLAESGSELRLNEQTVDEQGNTHTVFQQMFNGIPVWGHDLAAHLTADGTLYYLNAHTVATPATMRSVSAGVSARTAIQTAQIENAGHAPQVQFDDLTKRMLDYNGPTAKQYIWIDDATGTPHLIWFVEMRPNLRDRWFYFIDAIDGTILERYNDTQTDGPVTATATDLNGKTRTIHAYQVGTDYFMIDASRPIWQANQTALPGDPRGALWTIDVRNHDLDDQVQFFQVGSTNNTWTDQASVSANYNVGQVYEYYANTFGRLGIDGKGSTIISVIHVTKNSAGMDNAYWNGKVMAYGDGNRALKPLAGGLDVAAHEMTHGVIERTVDLEYKNQSGALNESFADVFGVMVDAANWTVGEDVVKPEFFPSGALRSMSDPHNGASGPSSSSWQPATMAEFQHLTIDQDNGGVHTNSGIPNHACYLIANAIGRTKTQSIYYRILNNKYLNQQATFTDMRLAAEQAATELFGTGPELNAVKSAFDQVGITQGNGSQPPGSETPVNGEQWIACVNDASNDHSLYKVKPTVQTNADIVQLTTTQVYTQTGNPLSVSDNGAVILFIDGSNYIRAIASDGTNERVISNAGEWSSLALSPDASKLAATTIHSDSVIYIFDLITPANSYTVRLFSPTTQDSIRNYIVEYADALSWNHDGSVLLYDAFNRIPQSGGTDLTYWDINAYVIPENKIYRIFAPQPKGIDMGNPSFSRNTDQFILFDYIHNGRDSIFAFDLFKGKVGLIFDNGPTIGAPRYSSDDQFIVFQSVENNVTVVDKIPVQNKMVPTGSPVAIVNGALLPTWFAIGTRTTDVNDPVTALPGEMRLMQNYPNPFNPSTAISFILAQPGLVTLRVYDMLGRELATLLNERKDGGVHTISWNPGNLPSGVYFYTLTSSGRTETRKMQLIR